MREFVSIRINLQCFTVLLALTLIFVACDSGENSTVNATQSGDDYVYESYQELVLKTNCNKITEWVEVRVVNEGVYTCMQFNDSWRWNRACEYKGVKHADGSGWMDGCTVYSCSSGNIVQAGGYGGGMCPGRSSSSFFRSSWSISSSSSLNQGTFLSSSMIRGLSISSSSNAEIHAISSSAVKNSIVYGSLVDNRDGQIYKTVTIGSQIWMAENLNYKKVNSKELDDNRDEKKYGRLYKWLEAVEACPVGWHLPSEVELDTLIEFAGGINLAGDKLKTVSGWNDGVRIRAGNKYRCSGNGSDIYGFAMFPFNNGNGAGKWACIWSSTINNDMDKANYYDMCMYNTSDSVQLNAFHSSDYENYVRCIKDNTALVRDSLIDNRDGKIYRTITVGNQTWMAENLNYDYKVNGSTYGTYVNSDNGKIYGRYYTWAAAMDSAGVFSDESRGCGFDRKCSPESQTRGVCPEGWRIPASSEWEALYNSMGNSNYVVQSKIYVDGPSVYGFSLVNAGQYGHLYYEGGAIGYEFIEEFVGVDEVAYYWSATEFNSGGAYLWEHFVDNRGGVGIISKEHKGVAAPVRCVKGLLKSSSSENTPKPSTSIKACGVYFSCGDDDCVKCVKNRTTVCPGGDLLRTMIREPCGCL